MKACILGSLIFIILLNQVNAQGNWIFTSSKDAIYDTKITTISISSLDGSASLFWRCSGDLLEFFVGTNKFLDSSSISVVYKFDNETASRTQEWGSSTKGTGVFAPLEELKKLFNLFTKSKRFTVRLYDFQGSEYTYTFLASGFSKASLKLHCTRSALSSTSSSVNPMLNLANPNVAFVSVRDFSTNFGAKFAFERPKILITRGDKTILMTLGKIEFSVNEKPEFLLPAAPTITNEGMIVVPAKALIAFGCTVSLLQSDPFQVAVECPISDSNSGDLTYLPRR